MTELLATVAILAVVSLFFIAASITRIGDELHEINKRIEGRQWDEWTKKYVRSHDERR